MAQKDEVEKKNDVVLKLDLHCEGCVKKIKRALLRFDGVEDVKADTDGNKLTVIGKVDPNKVRDKLAEKIKKNVELVSSPPKKAAAAAVDKPPPAKNKHDEEEEKKPDEKKAEEKPPKQSVENTVVLKIRLHCDACIKKIEKIILKIKGVESVNIDGGKDLVTIKGTTDAKEIVAYLTEKLKRDVEVIQPKKEEDNKKNKEKKEEGGGGEKKEGGKAKVEVNKMEHYGYGQQPPMYWYDGFEPGQSSSNRVEVQPGGYSYSNQQGQNYNYANQEGYNYNYMNMNQNHQQQGYDYSYGNQGYMVEPQQPPFYLHPNHPPPQMFSDENPNACSIM
ncbi:hypothetical protein RYX36_031641 [Vicia faba]